MSYQFALETLHKFAFYLCVIPFRIQKTKTGIYFAETNRFQKLISIIFSTLPLNWHFVNLYNRYKKIFWSRHVYPGDPTPFFALLYRLTFSLSTCHLLYKLVFHKKVYIHYLNTISKVLNRYTAHRNAGEPKKIWKSIILILLFFHACVGINLFFILRHYNLTLKTVLFLIQEFFLIEELSSYVIIDNHTTGNYVLAVVFIVACVIRLVQESYCALLYAISIYSLVVVSQQFRNSCRNQFEVEVNLRHYRSVCRLTRYHNKYFGWGLLWFLLSGLFFGTLFTAFYNNNSKFSRFGFQLYKIWFASFYLITLGLGITFKRMMGEISRLLETKKPLGSSRQALIMHFKNQEFCKINAALMPISYSVLTNSAAFAMTVLMVTMSQDCPKCI